MDRDGLNLDELSDFADELAEIAHTIPKSMKKFLQSEGSKLKRKTKARAKKEVGTAHKKPKKYADSKHYVDTIKRGKVYHYRGSTEMAVRTYSSAPHAHLIEKGHRLVSHGKEVGFIPGKNIFGKTEQEFKSIYVKDAEKFYSDALGKIER